MIVLSLGAINPTLILIRVHAIMNIFVTTGTNNSTSNYQYFKQREFILTSKYKPIVCALKNYNLNSKEKFEPGPGFKSQNSRKIYTCTVNWTRIALVVEHQARDLEVRGLNPGPRLNFSLEFKFILPSKQFFPN